MLPNDPIILLSYVNTKLRDDYADLDDLCGALDTPILTDQVVKDAVLDQVPGLLSGSLTPEDAAAAVVKKVSLYLAE